jgi:hypothetical protein
MLEFKKTCSSWRRRDKNEGGRDMIAKVRANIKEGILDWAFCMLHKMLVKRVVIESWVVRSKKEGIVSGFKMSGGGRGFCSVLELVSPQLQLRVQMF